jgi:hypothetical protein
MEEGAAFAAAIAPEEREEDSLEGGHSRQHYSQVYFHFVHTCVLVSALFAFVCWSLTSGLSVSLPE